MPRSPSWWISGQPGVVPAGLLRLKCINLRARWPEGAWFLRSTRRNTRRSLLSFGFGRFPISCSCAEELLLQSEQALFHGQKCVGGSRWRLDRVPLYRWSLEPARPGVASFLPAEYPGAISISAVTLAQTAIWAFFRRLVNPSRHRGLAEMGKQVVVVLYLAAMVAVIVGVDFVFFRNRFWERLTVNIGIVLVFVAFYFRFLRRP
jgi:hypothetical protein